MSPEQALGEAAVDHRTDVYALGCVLYEMLTGEPPFAGTDVRAVLSQIVTAPAPRIQSRAVPKRVRQAVARALSKTANDRYATVKRFTAALTSEDSTANRMLAVTASLLSLLPL